MTVTRTNGPLLVLLLVGEVAVVVVVVCCMVLFLSCSHLFALNVFLARMKIVADEVALLAL